VNQKPDQRRLFAVHFHPCHAVVVGQFRPAFGQAQGAGGRNQERNRRAMLDRLAGQ
jgi:hypothetical protein